MSASLTPDQVPSSLFFERRYTHAISQNWELSETDLYSDILYDKEQGKKVIYKI